MVAVAPAAGELMTDEPAVRWAEQMARVERWQQRYRDISRNNQRLLQRELGRMGSDHALAFLEEGEAASDVAYTLIQSIHHLRDWLINDPGRG
jgi:hypothetical protein